MRMCDCKCSCIEATFGKTCRHSGHTSSGDEVAVDSASLEEVVVSAGEASGGVLDDTR
jgi:hypothetical protein